MPITCLGYYADESIKHEGIGTIKMRSKRPNHTVQAMSPSVAGAEERSPLALLQSATATILAPIAMGQKPSVALGNEQHEEDEEEEPTLVDDGLSSSSDDEFEDATSEADRGESPLEILSDETTPETYDRKPSPKHANSSQPRPNDLPLHPARLLPPSQKASQTPSRQTSMPGYFDRPTQPHHNNASPALSNPPTPGGSKRRPIFKGKRSATPSKRSTRDFAFDTSQGKDVQGIVMVEIKSAADLPKIKNCMWSWLWAESR